VAPGAGAIRLTRVTLFALAAVGLTVGAHLAGGEQVPVPLALAGVPVVMIVINLLATRRRGIGTLLPAMGVMQVLLHVAFMLVSTAGGCRAVGDHMMAGSPGVSSAGMVGMSCDPAMAGAGGHERMWPTTSMAIAHVLATVLIVLLLAYGESAIWALAGCLRFRFTLPGAQIPLPAARPLAVVVRAAFLPRSDVPRRGVRRRGPPALGSTVLSHC
jgi:hypothetical protein